MRIMMNARVIGTLLVFSAVSVFGLRAQEKSQYGEQIAAYKQCFKDKSGEKIKPYLSEDIGFPPLPQDRLAEILDQLFMQFFSTELVSLEVKSSKPGEVVMIYDYGDFQELGVRESAILFNEAGEISSIKEIEEIIQLSRAKRRAEVPKPDELSTQYPSKKVTFETPSKTTIYGDLYEVNENAPIILLCHQMGWNRFEYANIAPKLNELGYNALAVDMAGGGSFADRPNETVEGRGDPEGEVMLDYAEEELAAAIDYLNKRYHKKVTVWGSSYSATLVIYAAEKNRDVNASISFSGFNHFREARPKLETILPKIKKPMFMTSSKGESEIIDEILKDLKLRKNQYHFTPEGRGEHGSKALWNGKDEAPEYWTEIKKFLAEVYPNR